MLIVLKRQSRGGWTVPVGEAVTLAGRALIGKTGVEAPVQSR